MSKTTKKLTLIQRFDSLPTPVKIIIFTQIANFLLMLSELAVFDMRIAIDGFLRGVLATLLNIVLWYLTQLKK